VDHGVVPQILLLTLSLDSKRSAVVTAKSFAKAKEIKKRDCLLRNSLTSREKSV
jgi:hypothetical protein